VDETVKNPKVTLHLFCMCSQFVLVTLH
jgi:hypothetical protein